MKYLMILLLVLSCSSPGIDPVAPNARIAPPGPEPPTAVPTFGMVVLKSGVFTDCYAADRGTYVDVYIDAPQVYVGGMYQLWVRTPYSLPHRWRKFSGITMADEPIGGMEMIPSEGGKYIVILSRATFMQWASVDYKLVGIVQL